MGKRSRFVQPETVRIDLSDGDWIRVKKQLNVKETREVWKPIMGEIKDGWRRPNIEMVGISEIVAYVVDWSFTDANDNRVKVSMEAVGDLDQESFDEIDAALKTHIAAMETERAERKNAPGTSSASEAT